jgi:hypothetical protein
LTTATNGTGVDVGGTGVKLGSGEITTVSDGTTTVDVLVETGLLLLHVDNKMENRLILIRITRDRRKLIEQIILVNQFHSPLEGNPPASQNNSSYSNCLDMDAFHRRSLDRK